MKGTLPVEQCCLPAVGSFAGQAPAGKATEGAFGAANGNPVCQILGIRSKREELEFRAESPVPKRKSREIFAALRPSRSGLSGSLFGDQRTRGYFPRRSTHDSHFLPVIGEFLAAIQAHHIRAEPCSRLTIAACSGSRGHGKTIARVPAAKHRVHQFREHYCLLPPSPENAAHRSNRILLPTFITLDSETPGKVR